MKRFFITLYGLAFAVSAQATVIININLVAGTTGYNPNYIAAAGTVGSETTQTWNTLYTNSASNPSLGVTFSAINLKDSQNGATTVEFTAGNSTDTLDIYRGSAPTQYPDIFTNYTYKTGTFAVPFTVSQLAANTAYDFYFYGQNANFNNQYKSSWQIGSTSASISGGYVTVADSWQTYNGTVWTQLTATSDGSGNISGTWFNNGSAQNVWNGLQIVAVPETATWAILSGSLLLVAIFRRRQV